MSKENLNRLKERASNAENLIASLKSQLDIAKQSTIQLSTTKLHKDREKLIQSNEKLRLEVEYYKQKLNELERRNGVTPIFVPNNNRSKQISNANIPVPPLPATKISLSQNGEKESESQKKSKPKEKQNVRKSESQTKVPTNEELVDVSKLDFRIGRIINVKKHPDADSLYVEEVDVGEAQPRVVVSGLVNHVKQEEMNNRLVVLLCNLKPAKMRGVTSEAMVMCASSPEKVEILIPPENSVPGERIIFEGYPGNPEPLLNPKKKIFEQIQPDLRTSANKVATYKGIPFTVPGKGIVVAATMINAAIK